MLECTLQGLPVDITASPPLAACAIPTSRPPSHHTISIAIYLLFIFIVTSILLFSFIFSHVPTTSFYKLFLTVINLWHIETEIKDFVCMYLPLFILFCFCKSLVLTRFCSDGGKKLPSKVRQIICMYL